MRRVALRAGQVAAALVLAVVLYVVAGLIGGLLPANPAWRAPAEGVTIYVESNGIHTDLVMPKVAAGVDWRDLARPRDLRDPRYARYDHVAIGWGDKAFFLQTQHWSDVRPGTAIAAASGSEATLLHIEHLPPPRRAADVRRLTLRPDEYRRLAAFIRASVAPGGRHYPGYDRNDAFLDARGRYSAVRTCNSWTGEALRAAGVRVGRWTPFPWTVLRWF